MKKLSQRGLIDLHIVVIALVVVLAGGFTIFRVSSSSDTQGNLDASNSENLSTDANSDLDAIENADNIEENPNQSDDPSSQDISPSQSTNTSPGTPSSVTEANFVKGGVGPPAGSNMHVDVSVSMDAAYSGTCTYTFTLGNTTVTQTDSITNSKVCDIDVGVEIFPKNGVYSVAIGFESNDQTVQASVDGFSVDVSPAEFNFVKGGGSYDGTNVVISETSTLGHTGTCNYVFTQDSDRIERSNNISNSRTCAISIPGTDFPSTGDWDYTLTFEGTTEFVVGSGGGYEISID